jgi:hypothetical protein
MQYSSIVTYINNEAGEEIGTYRAADARDNNRRQAQEKNA